MPFDRGACRCYAVGIISFSAAGLILSCYADEAEINNHLQLPIYVSTLFIRVASVIGVIEGVFVLCTSGRVLDQVSRLWSMRYGGAPRNARVPYEPEQHIVV